MAKRTCTAVFDGVPCGRPHWARGYCSTHLDQFYRKGYVWPIKPKPKLGWPSNLTEQTIRLENGCLFWNGKRLLKGNYGTVRREGKDIPAHVAAHLLWVGPIPEGYEVDHLCHDPEVCKLGDDCPHRRCVEPSHRGLSS